MSRERNPEIRPNRELPLFEQSFYKFEQTKSGLSTQSFPSAQCETGVQPRRSANSSAAPDKAHARRNDPATSKEISLTRGMVALVDEQDHTFLSQWKWYAAKRDGRFYAARDDWKSNRTIYMHRLLMNPDAHQTVDHINRDGLDNRRANLRLATQSENNANQAKRSNNTSGFKGVTFSKAAKKWAAQIMVNGKHIHLGLHLTAEDAHHAYVEAAKQRFGEFARFV